MPSSADEHGPDGADGQTAAVRNLPTRRKRMTRAGRRAARNPPPRFACPCCDYITLAERGRHLICPICFWEDEDVLYDTNHLEPSAANHGLAMTDARRNFRRFGACDASMLKNVLPEANRSAFRHRSHDE